ncbi:MAG: dienelactone hydrolase family protein [Chloroflexi bacterium]|nr:dienelactone hydrolase family protein [Chloroflexota bacterium]
MKVAATLVAIAFALYVVLSGLGAILIMDIPRLPLEGSPSSVGLNYEDVSFLSRGDGVVLKGWYLPAQGDTVIIIVNGGFQNRIDYEIDTLGLARDLVERGYNLLLFDLRGRGESQGRGRPLSNIDSDIGGAVDYLSSRGYSVESIGIIGFCSGAASSCIFASRNNVGALALDGCFASVRGMVTKQAIERGIPKFLLDAFLPGLTFMVKTFYGFEPIDTIDVVPDVKCPIFFIHDGNDVLISWEETYRLFKASNNPANEIWEVSETQHSQSYKRYPDEYVARLDGFFATRLKSDLTGDGIKGCLNSAGVLSQK